MDIAHDEIASQKKNAVRELESSVAELSSAVAAKIIKREVDAKAHQDIIKDVLSEI